VSWRSDYFLTFMRGPIFPEESGGKNFQAFLARTLSKEFFIRILKEKKNIYMHIYFAHYVRKSFRSFHSLWEYSPRSRISSRFPAKKNAN